MSFLNPWLWVGAAALAVPVWLHLRAKSGPVFRFPTLRFLEDQPRPRARGFRLRDALLLLVRCAGLLLLVAAFAWPYLQRGGARVLESRVHVLDGTLSRQAGGFERDRDRVRQALLEGGADAQDAVIELTARPRVVVGFADDRLDGAARVARLEPSFARGSYLEALRLAQAMLAQSLGSRRRIVVYADHQENQWTENETSPPFLEGVEVELADKPGQPARPNLSLGDASVRRYFLGEHAYVDLSAELRHEGPFRSARVRLTANGAEVLAQDVPLDRVLGTVTLRGQWRSDPGQWVRGELAIEGAGDALAADDRVFFALPPLREGRLALLARSSYLRAALAPKTMRGRWATRQLDPSRPDLAQGPEKELPEVLVLEGDYAQSAQVRALALRCLNNGRGVLLFLGRLTPLLKGFLSELGLEGAEGGPAEGEQAFRLVAADHPVFKPFLYGELGDLAQPRVFGPVRLVSRQAVPLLVAASGDPLLLEGTASPGRLLVFAFAMERRQTDWPLLPTFIPFLDLALQHARAATELQTSVAPGELLVHELPPGTSHREVVLRDGPLERQRFPVDERGTARVEAPARPGIYVLTYDADPEAQALIAVNPSPKESVLRYVESPAAIEAWTLADRPLQESADPLPAPARLLALDQRLWWWCLIAAAAALLLETAVLLRRRQAA